MAEPSRQEVLANLLTCLETIHQEARNDTRALGKKVFAAIDEWKEERRRRLAAEADCVKQLTELEPTDDEAVPFRNAMGELLEVMPTRIALQQGNFHLVYKKIREDDDEEEEETGVAPSVEETTLPEAILALARANVTVISSEHDEVLPSGPVPIPSTSSLELLPTSEVLDYNQPFSSPNQSATQTPGQGYETNDEAASLYDPASPPIPTPAPALADESEDELEVSTDDDVPLAILMKNRGSPSKSKTATTTMATSSDNHRRRTRGPNTRQAPAPLWGPAGSVTSDTIKEMTIEEVKQDGYWVFEHGSTQRRVKLYVLRCPGKNCKNPVFVQHPFRKNRAISHFRKCGFRFVNVSNLVHRFAYRVVQGDSSAPVTRLWAMKHNNTLVGANDDDLRAENLRVEGEEEEDELHMEGFGADGEKTTT